MNKCYAKDRNNIYLIKKSYPNRIIHNEIFKNDNPNDFEILNEDFAKDKNYVYDYGYSCDKIVQKFLYKGQIIDNSSFIDAETFQIIKDVAFSSFGKDKNYVYELHSFSTNADFEVIDGIDPNTFETITYVAPDPNWPGHNLRYEWLIDNNSVFGKKTNEFDWKVWTKIDDINPQEIKLKK